jgi:excinuclease ABC subunit A
VTVAGRNIHQVCSLSIGECMEFFQHLDLTSQERQISERIMKEIKERLRFLLDVGLAYLSLDRSATSLSGGEAQRIRLATQIGSGLVGVLYVLDEPTIGLHQSDNERLIGTLKRLRDMGNTVLVVEHDADMMLKSDYIIDMGPGAGLQGGEVIFKVRRKKYVMIKIPSRAAIYRAVSLFPCRPSDARQRGLLSWKGPMSTI